MLPLAGAIAGGNCVVLKPSELAPRTADLINKMIQELFSPGYVLCMEGDGASVIPEMMNGFRFDHVFFTGSVAVGRKIYQMAAEKLVPVTLELGGKSPAIVEADADLEIAAKRIAVAKFLNTGQTCVAPDYVLVQNSVKERFIDKLKFAIRKFYTGDPAESHDYGRIINEKRFDRLIGYLNEGTIVYGGSYDRASLFITPTIMENVSMSGELMKEEIFGPILPVIGYSDPEQAMAIIKQNPDPLSLYVFTKSIANEKRWIDTIAFGGGCVNNAAWQFTNHHLPFGGVGNSGIGSYHGKYSFNTFTRAKPVMKSPLWFDPKIKYPSFKGRLGLLKRIFR
jgi:aldehyde dehydrogenase (NAD+)